MKTGYFVYQCDFLTILLISLNFFLFYNDFYLVWENINNSVKAILPFVYNIEHEIMAEK